ncbi:MAG: hypothetical protein U9R79_07710 [Armatimonadota bacterium]|nr:hypothetical protein [Armatimonadota bacterium]
MLQSKGCRLFLYFWTNGMYEGPHSRDPPYGDWCEELVSRSADQLLSPQPLPSLSGQPAYYFDFTSEALRSRLCEELAAARLLTGYDGIFFDYAGEYALPPEVVELWRTRHPGVPYDTAVAAFLALLRARDPDCLIFTNQAFRSDQPILADVDYDLAESYATSHAWGPETEVGGETVRETYFRPWSGHLGIEEMYRACTEALRRTPPRGELFFLDYARPRYRGAENAVLQRALDLEAIYYSYCAAALWGHHSFCSGWYSGHEYRGPLYFVDLGQPLGEGPEELDGAVLREYEHGVVVLMTSLEPVEIDCELQTRPGMSLYDLFASTWLERQGGRFHLRLAASRRALSGTRHPIGRVYLKARRL